ncbi:NAD(P)/FAD-dependent oxidoreductase [Neisseria perflava]|uniref:NAD(P)/FAD-dependent oxidoreductase n=1 Tax=Neisseria perflava TaxID=33053 RepID=UPI0020A1C80B|nr:FAD-binding oxidoreductase [Neisseria perflava]MCP1659691.1 glycine/D-amino acid oxidase-like deaminating enzyme [Neisseria perflava]MCP1771289.1 glycine/D-amino acid oxidase-like deaminating enzyme [Neisseria perflava]
MIQVKALPDDDQACGWFHTAPQRTAKPAHSGNSQVRWAVIGAGYVGLAAARRLAERFPDDEVALIEAQEVGFGTAGRNAGFAIDLPHDIGADDYIGDVETAKMVLKLNKTGQQYLAGLVGKHNIQCHMRHSGKYQAAVEPRGLAVLKAYRSGLDKLGEPYEVINGQDLPNHIGTSFYKEALFTPGTILLQPSALVKGLADSLPANVSLYEHTAITGVDYGEKVTLTHAGGTITADKLILANNAFGQHFGFLKGRFIPLFLYASLSRPLNEDEQARLGGKDFWGVIPADPGGSTVRRTHDNRILMRNSFSFHPNGVGDRSKLAKFRENHRKSFANRFPMLPDVDFEYTWSGQLAMTRNHQSFFGQLAPNVYAALGCNGLGVTRGTVSGMLLADWLAGEKNDMIDFLLASPGPNANPPEPFLSVGVNLSLWNTWRKAGLEA